MSQSKYKQIFAELKKQILGAKFDSSNPFPSEAAVAREKQTTRNTVHRAFIELRRLGLIEGEPGVAPRVAAGKVSRKIGLIVPGVAYSEFFHPIVGEISRLSQEQGYTLIFGNISSKDPAKRATQAKRFAKALVREGVAGVICQPLEFVEDSERLNQEIVSIFDAVKVAVVLIDCDFVLPPRRSNYDVVGISNYDAGYRLGDYLMSKKAKRVDFLIRPNSAAAQANRMRGVIAAVKDKGGKARTLVAAPDDEVAIRGHLKEGRPDAFLCGDDHSAAMLMKTLAKLGLRVPDDILLAGFDDVQIASLTTPGLTTIHQPCEDIARETFRALLDRIAERMRPVREIYLPAPLVERVSTCREPKDKTPSMKTLVLTACALLTSTLLAALEPLAPVGGAAVPLIPDAQKKVMALPTLAERIRLLQDDRKSGGVLAQDRFWRKAKPLDLEFRVTEGEKGPWKVEIGKCADLSDARTWYVPAPETEDVTGREVAQTVTPEVVRITLPMANLEVATRYYWRVSYRGYCGFGCHPKHGCKVCGNLTESPVAAFLTEDLAPRWIVTEGDVGNIRDLGGCIGRDGRRVRQGLIYRGQAFNDNSVNGEVHGRSRLTVEDIRYLAGTLGIKTDLDLRGIGETADMTGSPLGEGVEHVLRYSYKYKDLFGPEGMKTMAENFRLFCDRKNYPIYFHCIAGADRTGSLAYVLNGVLGVSRQEVETEWESTFYPNIPDENPDPDFWRRESHFNDGFAKYGNADTPWQERIVLYLKACGITDAEIETFRGIMLER